jgi:Photosynthesis system II assembly factor YCF48/Putative zinc-finger
MSDRKRDASMERLLREAMAGDHRPPASECLDPETLAAWVDGALSSSERSFAEAHAARCASCQAMLATTIRTVPAPAHVPSRMRRWLMLAGPALAAAAAAALWFAVEPRLDQRSGIGLEVDQSARREAAAPAPAAPVPAPEPSAAPPPAADRTMALADKETLSEQKRAATTPGAELGRVATEKSVDARAKVEKDNAAPSAAAPVAEQPPAQAAPVEQSAGARQRFASNVPLPSALPSPPPPPPASPAQPTAQAPQQAAQGQQAAQASARPDQAQQVAGYAGSGRAPADSRARGSSDSAGFSKTPPAATNESTLALRVAPGSVYLPVPGSNVRWRVVAGQTIQHSADGGATWATQYRDERIMLLAGAAPAPAAAWLAGRSGVVLVTTDGRTWTRTNFPEAVDLVSVSAADARTATVTTADKRTFVTSDGGKSWKLQ